MKRRIAWAEWRKLSKDEQAACAASDGGTMPKKRQAPRSERSAEKKPRAQLANLGDALVDCCQEVLPSVSKALFASVCCRAGLGSRARNKLVPGSAKWKSQPKRVGGRPTGAYAKLAHEDMLQIVANSTSPSCRFSMRHKLCIGTLHKSRKRIWTRLRHKVSYSWFCKRLKKFAVASPKKRVDVCKVCRTCSYVPLPYSCSDILPK